MKKILLAICVLALAAGAQAQEQSTDARAVITNLAVSAKQDLAQSEAQLRALREQIATEKLPLAQELTRLEDQLLALRKKNDQITGQSGTSAINKVKLEAETKARQDELAYVSNLLDEYARNFETKIHPCELQNLGKAIDDAKQLAANAALTPTEKFARQNTFVALTFNRLFDAIGGMKFQGQGIDADKNVLDGHFALIGPIALFGSNAGAAGMVIPQANSPMPLIRPLEGQMQVGLSELVDKGEGWLPLDPSRGAALKALVQKFSLIHIFEKGGPIMWPLLFASILALGTVLERLLFLFMQRVRRDQKALNSFFDAVTKGDIAAANAIGAKSKFYVVRALGYALHHREQSMASALLYAQARELKRFERGIPVLDTVITLAPLLGLLGTVTGMMGSFSLIGGDLSAPGAITGGIAEALIATAFGLGIAITALIPFNFLNARIEQARHEIEAASTQLELLAVRTQPALASAAVDNAPKAKE